MIKVPLITFVAMLISRLFYIFPKFLSEICVNCLYNQNKSISFVARKSNPCSMLILDFNMKELYLYRRLQGFIKSRISRKSVSQIFCDDLQTEKVKYILHGESGQGLEMIRNLENRIIKKIHNRCDRGSLCVFFRMEREKAESCRKRGIL